METNRDLTDDETEQIDSDPTYEAWKLLLPIPISISSSSLRSYL